MKKEEIRKQFFKLRIKEHSYSQCRKILRGTHNYDVTIRTLKRWSKRLDEGNWDLRDSSRKPKTMHYKVTPELESKILAIRKKTGWGAAKIKHFVKGISESSIKRVLNKNNLSKPSANRRKRIKWIRWQREHPNSLWQVDHSDRKIADKWCLSVMDDCSRYALALIPLNRVTTSIVTRILDELIKIYGKPREILTDNGGAYGLRSKHSKFDRWCRRRGIKHIRTAIHSPQTIGKVERMFKTIDEELKFCDNNLELFRLRYNHFRPHSSLDGKAPSEIYFSFAGLF